MTPDIKLSVDLEAGDVTSAAGELQQRLKEIFENSAGKEVSINLQTLQANLVATSQKAQETAKAIESMENTPSSKMAELIEQERSVTAELEKANTALETAQANIQEFVKARGGTSPDSIVHTDVWNETLAKLHELKDTQAEVAEGSANFLRAVATAPKDLSESITGLIEEYKNAQNTISELTKESQPFLDKALFTEDANERAAAQAKYDEYSKTIDNLKQNLSIIPQLINEALSEFGIFPEITAEKFLGANTAISELETKIKEVRAELRQLRKDGREFTAIGDLRGFAPLSNAADDAKKQVQDLTEAQKENIKAQADLAETGKNVLAGELPDAYKKLIDKQQNYNNKISIGIRKIEELGDKEKSLSFGDIAKNSFGNSIVDFANNINRLPQMIENAMDEVAKALPPYVQIIYSVIKGAVKTIVGFIYNEIKTAFSTLANIVKNGITKALNTATLFL